MGEVGIMASFLRSAGRTGLVLALSGCGGFNAYNGLLDTGIADADADTDTDADADADADADTDSDTDADTDTDQPCQGPPNMWDLGAQGPQAGNAINPAYVGVWMDGIVHNGNIVDMSFDGSISSAWVAFEFFDSNVSHVCSAIFDASTSTNATGGWQTSSGGILYHAWNLNLAANQGFTNCPQFTGHGVADPRQWVAQRTWGVGYGQMVDLTSTLRDAVNDPAAWNNDWAPHVFSIYLYTGGSVAEEAGYTFSFPHTCYDIPSGTPPLPRPTGPISGYVGNAGAWYVYPMSSL